MATNYEFPSALSALERTSTARTHRFADDVKDLEQTLSELIFDQCEEGNTHLSITLDFLIDWSAHPTRYILTDGVMHKKALEIICEDLRVAGYKVSEMNSLIDVDWAESAIKSEETSTPTHTVLYASSTNGDDYSCTYRYPSYDQAKETMNALIRQFYEVDSLAKEDVVTEEGDNYWRAYKRDDPSANDVVITIIKKCDEEE